MSRCNNNQFKEICNIINNFSTRKKFTPSDIVKLAKFEIRELYVKNILSQLIGANFINKNYGNEKSKNNLPLIKNYQKIKDIPENLNLTDLSILRKVTYIK